MRYEDRRRRVVKLVAASSAGSGVAIAEGRRDCWGRAQEKQIDRERVVLGVQRADVYSEPNSAARSSRSTSAMYRRLAVESRS